MHGCRWQKCCCGDEMEDVALGLSTQAESGNIMGQQVNYSVSTGSGHKICVTVIGIIKETSHK